MKFHLRIMLTLVLLPLWSTVVLASGLEDKVREHTLANGMKILMVERHNAPTVAAWIRFKVGSVNERSDEHGMAHLLEHMLFKGTKTLGTKDWDAEKKFLPLIEETAQALMAERLKREKADTEKIAALSEKLAKLQEEADKYVVPDVYSELYAKNGAVGFNAFTSKDNTAYMVNLPANKLELWAAVESDRMQNAVLRQFYTERNVVMEERRRSYDAEPAGKLWENFMAAAFVIHPYGQPTIGWMSEIENLSLTQTERFLRAYYAPVNAVVAIIGDIDPEQTIALVEKYFGKIPPGVPVPPVAVEEPPQVGERRTEVIGDAEPELFIGFHKPAWPATDDYVFDVLDMLLTHGKTSRLYQKLVLEKQLATEVSSAAVPGTIYPNLFIISATPRNPHTAREVEEAIYAELERLKTEPVSERDLQRIFNNLEATEIRAMASNGGLAYRLTSFEATTGSWRNFIERRKQVAKVTPQEVMRVARTYFTEENRTVGTIKKREETK
ncbi:pitrilysin family protein [Geobacter sp. DSM 9736]|uniref:M16 family metallopeptidase n=1 Tax=Geobacter sp. DSM 9736 TaxID=1277350 RepID=UPI000B5091B8|nr:pitrilysin family protein [Geobacter sp. DSM 9736]SNB48095.1 Predicted Zn-dependent peptidase [Geobacter sp. DSM 9736]